MSIAEETIAKIDNPADAGSVIYQIMAHFNLAGTVFVPDDVRSAVDEYVEGQGPITSDILDEDDREVLTGEYFMYGNWDYISDRLTEVGNEVIAEGVAERMRELGV